MAKLHTLCLDIEHDYTLMCIHTTLENYRLAYFINQCLNINLKRRSEDLDFQDNKGGFSLYEYKDKINYRTFNLIANKHRVVDYKTTKNQALFFNTLISETKTNYLIKDKLKVDFFLKVSGDLSLSQKSKIVDCLNNIQQVITVYLTNPEQLKQKAHLIF